MRVLRTIMVFKLGVWAGMATAAALVKLAAPSRGDEDSDDVALVAVLDGIDLKSRARAFRGGSILAWLGGVELDLREAELAPGARLSVGTLLGGIDIKTPATWRVESSVKAIGGGVVAGTPAQDDEDAPVLTLDGVAVLGGIQAGAKTNAGAGD